MNSGLSHRTNSLLLREFVNVTQCLTNTAVRCSICKVALGVGGKLNDNRTSEFSVSFSIFFVFSLIFLPSVYLTRRAGFV